MSSITLVTFLKIQYKGASIYDRLNYQNGKRDDFAPLDDGSGDYTNTSPENIIPYSMPEPYSSTQNYYYLPFIYQGAAKNKTGDNLEAALFLANNALAMNDRIIEDGSYFRLKNVTLGYDIPVKESGMFSRCNIYVSGQNLITITDYSGYDPEITSFLWDATRIGVDFYQSPNVKAWTVGLNLEF